MSEVAAATMSASELGNTVTCYVGQGNGTHIYLLSKEICMSLGDARLQSSHIN
jgi:hypothetical protein